MRYALVGAQGLQGSYHFLKFIRERVDKHLAVAVLHTRSPDNVVDDMREFAGDWA